MWARRYYFHISQKNVPTLASCNFNKHWLILIILGKQHQHTFRNDMHIELSSSLHFYLLYLLLNSCDGNDAFWHHFMLVKQSSSFSRNHRILSPALCPPNSPVDPETRLTIEFGEWCRNVCTVYKTLVRDTSDLMQLISDTRITKRRSCWSMEKMVVCMCEGKRTSPWTSAKLKPAFFRATNFLPRKMCLRLFCHSYLKANKISKSQGINKVEYAYHFWKCTDAVYEKIIKISPCLSKPQLAKVGAFFWDTIYTLLHRNSTVDSHLLRHPPEMGDNLARSCFCWHALLFVSLFVNNITQKLLSCCGETFRWAMVLGFFGPNWAKFANNSK